jgi:hypothetical protein
MLKRLDSFWIRVVADGSWFSIDYDHEFPPGSQIHATHSLSNFRKVNFADPHFSVLARIVSYHKHLSGGGEGPAVFLEPDQNAVSVADCARITFRLSAGFTDAKSLINIYTFE